MITFTPRTFFVSLFLCFSFVGATVAQASSAWLTEGYCCAPNNPSFAQCQDLVSKAICDGNGGTLSEFRNTGDCVTCLQRTMGYCCAPNNPSFAQCQDLVSKATCDGNGGTLSEYRNTGDCVTCTQKTMGYCCAPNNPSFSSCRDRVSKSTCDANGGTLSEWNNTGVCASCNATSSSQHSLCGNGAIDTGEECDAGDLNADLSPGSPYRNIPSFCSKQCTLFWYNDRYIPVQCQFYEGSAVADRNVTCTARFGALFGQCTIAPGGHSCLTSLSLPMNNDERLYRPYLSGMLGGSAPTTTAYNGMNYVLNFPSLSGQQTSASSTAFSASPGPSSGIPPAGYEDEVITNFSTYSNPFPDTDLASREGKAAAELYRRAVIGGFPDGEFKGGRTVNRAEAAKFLLLARFGSVADVANSGRFPDVVDGQWYTKFVVTAADRGIIGGYPDGTFRPADTVNTAEFLKMLSLTFDLPLNLPYSYTDVSSQDWFAPYAGIAAKYDLFPGRREYLSPDYELPRNTVAIAIYQYLSQR